MRFRQTKLNLIKVTSEKDLKKKRKNFNFKLHSARVQGELTARIQHHLFHKHLLTLLEVSENHLHQGIFSEI